MAKFIVTYSSGGFTFYLRSTVWAGYLDRATVFETIDDAKAALERAREFMPYRTYKAAKITPHVGE